MIPDIEEDYRLIRKVMQMAPGFARCFRDFEKVVKTAMEALRNNSSSTMIVIPLRTGTSVSQLSKTLKQLDLDSETAIILGLDHHVYVSDEWLRSVKKAMQKLCKNKKYAAVNYIFTSAIPAKTLTKIFHDFRDVLNAISYINRSLGVRSYYFPFPVRIVREELRLALKQISDIESIFWLDADLVIPSYTLNKLRQLSERAGMVCGWYKDRHMPDGTSSVAVDEIVSPTERDTKLKEMVDDLQRKAAESISSQLRITMPFRPMPPSVPYWRLEASSQPCEVGYTGFGCVLCSKYVNDAASFLPSLGDSPTDNFAEDFQFSLNARRAGCKILLDPTIKCEHEE